MPTTILQRRSLQAAAGIGIGGLFLWLSLRGHDLAQLRDLSLSARPEWIAAGIVTYLATMGLRAMRWQLLLRPSAPEARLGAVAETLIMGYAVNNLLPARLGELFRADYAKRRLGLSRSEALGSIVLERGMDGLTIVILLGSGLLLLDTGTAAINAKREILWQAATLGAALFGAALLAAMLLGRRRSGDTATRGLQRRLADFRNSMAALRRPTAGTAAALSPLVWLGEAGALACVLTALGHPMGPAPLLVLTGAASLSTLIPTAPGYLGTFQYAFVLALTAVGGDGAVGLVAATLVQVFLFGSLTLLAAGIYSLSVLRRPRPGDA